MKKQIASVIAVWFSLIASVVAQTSPYTGVWRGTTSDNRNVYFRVTTGGVVDNLTVQVRLNFVTVACTYTLSARTDHPIQGDSLVVSVSGVIPTTVRGRFTSATAASGSYDSYSGGVFAICGSSLIVGTISVASRTWQATKTLVSSVEQLSAVPPNTFELFQNYPNPFNPLTIIEYLLPREEFVSLKVFSALGQEVAVLANERKSAGRHSVIFDAHNVSSGVYFYRLQAESYIDTKKLLLVK